LAYIANRAVPNKVMYELKSLSSSQWHIELSVACVKKLLISYISK